MAHQHTLWYRVKNASVITGQAMAIILFVMIGVYASNYVWDLMFRNEVRQSLSEILQSPAEIEVVSKYKFYPEDGVYHKEIKNVGLTYYCRNDGYTPGRTTRSGRFVSEGSLAVSQPLWQKEVWPGDLVYVKATGQWYKVEDTMNSKYTEPRVDIYTHSMKLAKSGSSKTDIVIMRQPR